MGAGCGTPIRGPWAGLETCELPPVGGGRALWPCSGRARKRPEPVRAALCGPGRARAAPTMARQAPVPGGDGLARARAAAGMATRDQVGLLARRYPAATAEVSGRHIRAADCIKRGINLSS
jgi:hypothetical protein